MPPGVISVLSAPDSSMLNPARYKLPISATPLMVPAKSDGYAGISSIQFLIIILTPEH